MPDPSPRSNSHAGLPLDVEQRVVARAALGEQEAIGELYDAYVEPLFRFCVSRVGNETDAEDLTEEIFLKVMRGIGSFQWRAVGAGGTFPRVAGGSGNGVTEEPAPPRGTLSQDGAAEQANSPFRAWLFRIARNHLVSHYRRQTLRAGAGEVPEWLPDQRMGPADLAERALTIEEVFRAVEALPQAQREVIQLRFGAGLSIAETAQALEKQQTNVKVLQHKGVKKLREMLEAQGAASESKKRR